MKMSKYYLDTNVLVFSFFNESQLDRSLKDILEDPNTTLLVPGTVIEELIALIQAGSITNYSNSFIKVKKGRQISDAMIIFKLLEDAGIQIVNVTQKHIKAYATLPMKADHKDPVDRQIIAQALSDKIPIISTDGKFGLYEDLGLQLIQ